MDPLLIVAIVAGCLLVGSFAPAIIAKIKGQPTDPNAPVAPKAGLQASVDDITAKIQAELTKLGIPQSLQNIKQFVEVGIALAGIDGLRKIVGDAVPTDRLATVEAAFTTIRTEVATTLLPQVTV